MSSINTDIPSEAALDGAEEHPAAADAAASKSPAELRQSERAVLDWWERVGQSGIWPTLPSLDLARMSTRDWRHRFLIRSDSSVESCTFLVYGQTVARLLGLPEEPAPQVPMVQLLPERYLPVFVDGCREVIAGRGPVRRSGALEHGDGTVELYRAVFLPVDAGLEQAALIYGAFNSRI